MLENIPDLGSEVAWLQREAEGKGRDDSWIGWRRKRKEIYYCLVNSSIGRRNNNHAQLLDRMVVKFAREVFHFVPTPKIPQKGEKESRSLGGELLLGQK